MSLLIELSDCPFYTNGLGFVQCRSGRFRWQLDNEFVATQVCGMINRALIPEADPFTFISTNTAKNGGPDL
jgi:hypothetical protein